jgi:hypothetical protein
MTSLHTRQARAFWLRAVIRAHGLTVEQIARLGGPSLPTVGRMVRGTPTEVASWDSLVARFRTRGLPTNLPD